MISTSSPPPTSTHLLPRVLKFLQNTNEWSNHCGWVLEQRRSLKQAKTPCLKRRRGNYIVIFKWTMKPSYFVIGQNFQSVKFHIELNQISPLWRGQRVIKRPFKNNLATAKWVMGISLSYKINRGGAMYSTGTIVNNLVLCTWKLLMRRVGEGNGTPLQYSCLEHPMDGGAW